MGELRIVFPELHGDSKGHGDIRFSPSADPPYPLSCGWM